MMDINRTPYVGGGAIYTSVLKANGHGAELNAKIYDAQGRRLDPWRLARCHDHWHQPLAT